MPPGSFPNRRERDWDDRRWAAPLHTRKKAQLGGKGVGRLTWLKVFDGALVESRTKVATGLQVRRFRFALPAGVSDEEEVSAKDGDTGTSVTLAGLKDRYREGLNVLPDTLARRIVEHFLTYFVLKVGVTIEFSDGELETTLGEVYRDIVSDDSGEDVLDVKGEAVHVRHFLVRGHPGGRHEVRWCARQRVVVADPLGHAEVPGLGNRVDQDDGQRLVYLCYVTSDLLTRSVNQARTRFSIPEAGSDDRPGMKDLKSAVAKAVGDFLAPRLFERRKSISERLAQFSADAPQYRFIVANHADRLAHISPDLDDRRLEVELAKIKAELVYDTREETRKVLEKGTQPKAEKLAELTAAITENQRSDLAGYVAHRRLVLDLVRAALRYRDGTTSYPYEKDVHKLIFPMSADTTELTGLDDEHNLWVLDERLAFYSYLASDKKFRQIETVEVPNDAEERRPDLIALDRVAAFGFGDELELRGITLVEFKRAEGMETDRDDPVARLLEYTRSLRDGNVVRPNGERVRLPEATPIYGFAICNLTPAFEETLEDTYKANKMADGSWFLSREKHRLQIHVVPYTVLVLNAEKRNAVFFDRAGLPTRPGGSGAK